MWSFSCSKADIATCGNIKNYVDLGMLLHECIDQFVVSFPWLLMIWKLACWITVFEFFINCAYGLFEKITHLSNEFRFFCIAFVIIEEGMPLLGTVFHHLVVRIYSRTRLRSPPHCEFGRRYNLYLWWLKSGVVVWVLFSFLSSCLEH